MKVRIEQDKKMDGVVWLVVDEVKEDFALRNKEGKVVKKYTETTVRCNIAIIDYNKVEDADRITEAITETLRKL